MGNVEGRDQLVLARDSEWAHYRNRIKGICEAIAAGEADDDEPEALTIEILEKTAPEKLEPLPPAQGLAVSQHYEKGTQEYKYQNAARGDGSARGASLAAQGASSSSTDGRSVLWDKYEHAVRTAFGDREKALKVLNVRKPRSLPLGDCAGRAPPHSHPGLGWRVPPPRYERG